MSNMNEQNETKSGNKLDMISSLQIKQVAEKKVDFIN